MGLQFANCRWFPAGVLDDEASWNTGWLRGSDFSPTEAKQLAVIAEQFLRDDAHDVFRASCADFGDMAVSALELWDVVNEQGAMVYKVWFYRGDCGAVFEGESTNQVGGFSEWASISPGPVAMALYEPAETAKEQHPGSELSGFDFE